MRDPGLAPPARRRCWRGTATGCWPSGSRARSGRSARGGRSAWVTPRSPARRTSSRPWTISEEADVAGAGGPGNPALLIAADEVAFKRHASRRDLSQAAAEVGGHGVEGRRAAMLRRFKPVHVHEAGVDRLLAIAYTRTDLDRLHLAGRRLAEVLGLDSRRRARQRGACRADPRVLGSVPPGAGDADDRAAPAHAGRCRPPRPSRGHWRCCRPASWPSRSVRPSRCWTSSRDARPR